MSRYNVKVVKEDYANGVKDDCGCIYSQDGKRLLFMDKKCTFDTYVVKEGVEVICDLAFSTCHSLQKVVLPNSVVAIGNYAFGRCTSLQSINLPSSLLEIGRSAFGYCSSLRNIEIPHSLMSIGNYAFERCILLRRIELPENLVYIGKRPVARGVEVKSLSKRFVIDDDLLIDTESKTLIQGLKDNETVVVPEGVEIINDMAFSGFTWLRRGVLPSSVKVIKKSAFMYCERLEDIVLPEGITTIGDEAFMGCGMLEDITLPSSLTTIGSKVFPLGVEIRSLADKFVVEDGLLIDIEAKTMVQCIYDKEEMKIPDYITKIDNAAFCDCEDLCKIIIPASLKEIGEQAFYHCIHLYNIVWNDNVEIVGRNAFCFCEELEEVVFPQSVRYINYGAFCECYSLRNVALPDSLLSIGDYAFWNCSLKNISLPSGIAMIGSCVFDNNVEVASNSYRFLMKDNLLIDIENKHLVQCFGIAPTVVIPDIIETIEFGAFAENSVKDIVLPFSLKGIDMFPFCWNMLETIFVPKGRKQYYEQLFDKNDSGELKVKLKELE